MGAKFRIAYHDSQTGKQAFIGDAAAMEEPQARKLLEQLNRTNSESRFTFWLVKAEREEPR